MNTTPKQTPKQLKAAFLGLLRESFRDVATEAKFPWLTVLDKFDSSSAVGAIHDALVSHRGKDGFAKPGRQLRCDYYLPEHAMIIEVDERQHFSEPRAVALRNYPKGVQLGFDRGLWIEECARIQAIDNDPHYRDEQRAFYDSLRDLLAPAFGMKPLISLTLSDIGPGSAAKESIQRIEYQLKGK